MFNVVDCNVVRTPPKTEPTTAQYFLGPEQVQSCVISCVPFIFIQAGNGIKNFAAIFCGMQLPGQDWYQVPVWEIRILQVGVCINHLRRPATLTIDMSEATLSLIFTKYSDVVLSVYCHFLRPQTIQVILIAFNFKGSTLKLKVVPPNLEVNL